MTACTSGPGNDSRSQPVKANEKVEVPQAPTKAPWYDVQPLLEGIVPEEAAAAKKALELDDLSELTHYELGLNFSADLRRFELSEHVWFTQRGTEPLSEVVLRVFANARKPAGERPVSFVSAECEPIACKSNWEDRGVLHVEPAQPLAPGARIKMKLALRGTLTAIDASRTNMFSQAFEGLQRMTAHDSNADYGLLAYGNGIASLGDFYAVLAARRDGTWVTEDGGTIGDLGAAGELSHVSATIVAPTGTQIVSSGVLSRQTTKLSAQGQPGTTQANVVAGLVRNFGLLLSEHFGSHSDRVGDVTVRSWSLKNHDQVARKVLADAKAALASFQRRFGHYPYRELDVVEAPLIGGAGGVEFSGMMTVATMFYQPISGDSASGNHAVKTMPRLKHAATPFQDAMLRFVVAHEIAHQWWHGIVGSDARTDPFVDEALAQYSAVLFIEDTDGAAQAQREQARQVTANYHLMRAQDVADAPAAQPAQSFTNEIAYAGLIYGKAPMFFEKVRKQIGDRMFEAALRGYVERFRYRQVRPEDLLAAFEAPGQEQAVRKLARHWLYEAHGDEDLGQMDLGALMGMWQQDVDTSALMGDVTKMMEGLVGELGKLPGDSKTDDDDSGHPQDLGKALQELHQLLGESPGQK